MKTNKSLCIVTVLTGLIGTARAADVAPGSTITLAQPSAVVATSQTVTSQPVILSQPVAQPPQAAIQAPQLLAYAPKSPAQGPQEFADISDVPQEIAQTTQSTGGAVVQGISSYNDINHEGAIGVGPMIGEPMGVTAKFWFNRKMAADAGVGWSFENPDGVQLHADFLYHFFDLFHNVGDGELPLYVGGGARLKFPDDSGQDNRAGIRFPVGAAYLCHNRPLEFYIEVAPILDVAPITQLRWNGGIGLRYYFR
jgi:hypothetical protein